MVTPWAIFCALLFRAPASAADDDGICRLPAAGTALADACPPLSEHLRAWTDGGAPEPLCPHTDAIWRRCKLHRLGLLSAEHLSAVESPASAVLASHYYGALLGSGTPEIDARAAALVIAGIPPQPRMVRLSVPPLPFPPSLPTGDRRAPCRPVITRSAEGLFFEGAALSTETAVEARLWTTLPALAAALPPPDGCSSVDIWADSTVPLGDLLPIVETLHRTGYRARLLAAQDGVDSPYAPLVGVRLRLAPGGAAHPDAIPITGAEDVEPAGGDWTGRVHLQHSAEAPVSALAAVARAANGDAVVWLSTTRDTLTPTDEAALVGELLLPGTPAARALRRQLDVQMPQFVACMDTALRRRPALTGSISAELAVSGGAVQAARLTSAEIEDVGLLSCLSEALEGLPLEADGPVVVGYTLTLGSE